ncbi:MAG: hypothetical protein KF813_04765 [Trueperaceae bacterium]|nr:hypothetical protein [Trueperaceae bacterium]
MSDNPYMTSEQVLAYWLGHRGLTRRVIEAFPDDQFSTFSIGGMRTCADLVREMLQMAAPTVEGAATRTWPNTPPRELSTKADFLAAWDADTASIEELWPQIPSGRFQEDDVAFGQWPGKVSWLIQYIVDNETHHRAQAYVYLRALGIEPPGFWDR